MNFKGLIKESFKPTKIKLVIILLLVFILIFMIYEIYPKSNSLMSNFCEGYQNYIIPALNALKEGDNETAEKLIKSFQERPELIDESFLELTLAMIYPVFDKTIPIFTPFCLPIVPFFVEDESICKRSYISEENYECIRSSLNEQSLLQNEIHGTDRVYIEKHEYKQVSYLSHIPGVMILVIESYFVLSFLSFIILLFKGKYYDYKLDRRFNPANKKRNR